MLTGVGAPTHLRYSVLFPHSRSGTWRRRRARLKKLWKPSRAGLAWARRQRNRHPRKLRKRLHPNPLRKARRRQRREQKRLAGDSDAANSRKLVARIL